MNSMTIQSNTQVTIGDLKIGVGNFRHEAAAEAESSHPTCVLWFYIRDHAELNRRERVQREQTIDIAGFQVHVVDVTMNEGQPHVVELVVSSPSA
jgi:hypothetical protein